MTVFTTGRRGLLPLAGAAWLPPTVAYASAWRPERPLRLIVSFAPGGSVDIFARTLQPHLAAALGQPVLVENHGGANTLIATQLVAGSPADGHTLLITSDSLSINHALLAAPGYDARRSFAPVTLGISAAQILVTHRNSGIRTVQDYVARVRALPGTVNVGLPGWAAIGHLASERLNQQLGGLSVEYVSYRGGAPAVADLLAGSTDALWITLPAVTAHVRDGSLLGLAVTTASRSEALPAVPTLAETVAPGFEVTTWQGILAPAATPPAAVEALHAAIGATLARPEVRARLDGLGFTVIGAPPAEFARHIARAVEDYGQVIRASGIRPIGS